MFIIRTRYTFPFLGIFQLYDFFEDIDQRVLVNTYKNQVIELVHV